MKHIGDLEVGTVIEDQISANHYVDEIRRRGRKHDFEFVRARVHVAARLHRNESVDDEPVPQPRRQVIAHGEARRQMPVVVVIPAAEVAVVIGVAEMIVVVVAPVFVAVVPVMIIAIMVVPGVIVAIVIAMAVIVILRGHGCRERE